MISPIATPLQGNVEASASNQNSLVPWKIDDSIKKALVPCAKILKFNLKDLRDVPTSTFSVPGLNKCEVDYFVRWDLIVHTLLENSESQMTEPTEHAP